MSIVHVAFYPSDWLAGTRGLSDAESGVYINLICKMYEMAGPIERDDERLYRVCGCKSKRAFVKSLEYLISEGKVIVSDDGLFNERVQKEIKVSTEKSLKAQAAAESRWNRKPNKNNDSADANASLEHMPQPCQPEPEPEPDKRDTIVSLKSSRTDLDIAFDAWQTAAEASGWAKIRSLSDARKAKLNATLKREGLDGWNAAIERAAASTHCTGGNDRGWKVSFDFLLSQGNFNKLMEGNYDDKTPQRTQPQQHAQTTMMEGIEDEFFNAGRAYQSYQSGSLESEPTLQVTGPTRQPREDPPKTRGDRDNHQQDVGKPVSAILSRTVGKGFGNGNH